jgi:hypothetical protein
MIIGRLKLKPSPEPSVCSLELDMLFVSDAIATSSTCAVTGVCSSCTSSVISINRGSKVNENYNDVFQLLWLHKID